MCLLSFSLFHYSTQLQYSIDTKFPSFKKLFCSPLRSRPKKASLFFFFFGFYFCKCMHTRETVLKCFSVLVWPATERDSDRGYFWRGYFWKLTSFCISCWLEFFWDQVIVCDNIMMLAIVNRHYSTTLIVFSETGIDSSGFVLIESDK